MKKKQVIDISNDGVSALEDYLSYDDELNDLYNSAIYRPDEEEALFKALVNSNVIYTQEQNDYLFESIEDMRCALD